MSFQPFKSTEYDRVCLDTVMVGNYLINYIEKKKKTREYLSSIVSLKLIVVKVIDLNAKNS